MSGFVRLQKLSNVRHKGIFRVGVGQERTNGEQDLANGQSWTPLIFENVEANSSVGIDIAVVDPSREMDLGRLEWVVRREMNV